jgi:hypothetical protein
VADAVKRNYIATLQHVGSFTSVTVKGGRKRGDKDKNVKGGGNVVTYFCTPEREVIHFVVGPVSEATLSSAADWAAAAYATIAKIEDRRERRDKLASEHEKLLETLKQQLGSDQEFKRISDALAGMKELTSEQIAGIFKSESDNPWRHLGFWHTSVPPCVLMSKLPLVQLATIEKPVFEYFAGQLGRFGGRSERSDQLLERAKAGLAKRRPLLLVVKVPANRWNQFTTVARIIEKPDVARYAKHFEVIHLQERELIALFDDLQLEPPPLAKGSNFAQIAAAIIGPDGKQSYGFMKADNIELRTVMRRVLAAKQRSAVSSSPAVVNVEVAAEKKLQLAKKLVGRNPTAAHRRYQSIARQYPGTKAAAAAKKLLAAK